MLSAFHYNICLYHPLCCCAKIHNSTYVCTFYVGLVGKLESSFKVPQSDIELWWPNEYGKQTMYLLNLQFTGEAEVSTKLTQVAFRCQVKVDITFVN